MGRLVFGGTPLGLGGLRGGGRPRGDNGGDWGFGIGCFAGGLPSSYRGNFGYRGPCVRGERALIKTSLPASLLLGGGVI